MSPTIQAGRVAPSDAASPSGLRCSRESPSWASGYSCSRKRMVRRNSGSGRRSRANNACKRAGEGARKAVQTCRASRHCVGTIGCFSPIAFSNWPGSSKPPYAVTSERVVRLRSYRLNQSSNCTSASWHSTVDPKHNTTSLCSAKPASAASRSSNTPGLPVQKSDRTRLSSDSESPAGTGPHSSESRHSIIFGRAGLKACRKLPPVEDPSTI